MKKDPSITTRARELRKNMTPAERILWKAIRSRRFANFKFRRQHPFGEYILDFYCSNTQLLLEIDGETHLGNEKADEKRSAWLQQQGVKVLRFWNTQIYDEFESVLEMIFRECDARKDLRFQSSQVDQNDK